MFWRSVVGKLAVTILLLVSFVLFILTILLLEFFENFHIAEAEKDLMQTATKVSYLMEQYDDEDLLYEMTDRIKDPSSRVAIVHKDDGLWVSPSNNTYLEKLNEQWIADDQDLSDVLDKHNKVKKQAAIPGKDEKMMIVGLPVSDDEAVFVYQSLNVVNQTTAQTTKIIFLAAGIAIVLTIIFAVFLSTRITSPLIKMREAAIDLTRGEFNKKVPILTHDEIGELATAFNQMGEQLNFHINALRQEKEQLSGIVNSMADGVITMNRNGDMIVTNPPAERFVRDWYFEHNLSVDEANWKLPTDLNQVLQEVIEGETEVLKEISILGRNWVMIMTPLYDQSFVRGAVAVIRDMTEERRLDKMRKDFIANVSHELRTPISLMQGYSEAIVDNVAESPEEKNDLAQIIHEESLRMGRLVNELLDLARMEAGHTQLNLAPVEVEPFAERIMKKFKGIADEQDVKLTLSKSIANPIVTCDEDQIEQVFTNLIDNAIRHTDSGGTVKVTVETNADEMHVMVTDSGSGIPEADLPFVFERFYKADKSRTRNTKKKGTGLGLSIAKNIINAHHGSISVQSKLNQGTTFTFKIPTHENH